MGRYLHKTKQTQQMNNYAFSWIRNSDPSNQAAAKLRIKLRGQRGSESLMDTAMPNAKKTHRH